jgi:DNA-binding response OmpR family regulator
MSEFPAQPAGDLIEKRGAANAPVIGVRALLVSGDIQTIDTLCHFMGQMAMHVEVCSDFTLASGKLDHYKFEALVVDFKQREEAEAFLKKSRQTRLHKAAVVLALLNSNAEMPNAFRAGASFVIVKPLSGRVLMRTLRVSYPLMVHERRRYFRCPLQIAVHVSGVAEHEIVATSDNISEGGMALTNARGLKLGDKVTLRFTLTGKEVAAKINAEVCWRDETGSAGMEFVNVSMGMKEELASWLEEKLEEYLHERQ